MMQTPPLIFLPLSIVRPDKLQRESYVHRFESSQLSNTTFQSPNSVSPHIYLTLNQPTMATALPGTQIPRPRRAARAAETAAHAGGGQWSRATPHAAADQQLQQPRRLHAAPLSLLRGGSSDPKVALLRLPGDPHGRLQRRRREQRRLYARHAAPHGDQDQFGRRRRESVDHPTPPESLRRSRGARRHCSLAKGGGRTMSTGLNPNLPRYEHNLVDEREGDGCIRLVLHRAVLLSLLSTCAIAFTPSV